MNNENLTNNEELMNNEEECLICMNNNKLNFVVLHENSDHKLCKSCYEKMSVPFCPFCRCNIKLHENISNIVKVDTNYIDNVISALVGARHSHEDTILMIMSGMGALTNEFDS